MDNLKSGQHNGLTVRLLPIKKGQPLNKGQMLILNVSIINGVLLCIDWIALPQESVNTKCYKYVETPAIIKMACMMSAQYRSQGTSPQSRPCDVKAQAFPVFHRDHPRTIIFELCVRVNNDRVNGEGLGSEATPPPPPPPFF